MKVAVSIGGFGVVVSLAPAVLDLLIRQDVLDGFFFFGTNDLAYLVPSTCIRILGGPALYVGYLVELDRCIQWWLMLWLASSLRFRSHAVFHFARLALSTRLRAGYNNFFVSFVLYLNRNDSSSVILKLVWRSPFFGKGEFARKDLGADGQSTEAEPLRLFAGDEGPCVIMHSDAVCFLSNASFSMSYQVSFSGLTVC